MRISWRTRRRRALIFKSASIIRQNAHTAIGNYVSKSFQKQNFNLLSPVCNLFWNKTEKRIWKEGDEPLSSKKDDFQMLTRAKRLAVNVAAFVKCWWRHNSFDFVRNYCFCVLFESSSPHLPPIHTGKTFDWLRCVSVRCFSQLILKKCALRVIVSLIAVSPWIINNGHTSLDCVKIIETWEPIIYSSFCHFSAIVWHWNYWQLTAL